MTFCPLIKHLKHSQINMKKNEDFTGFLRLPNVIFPTVLNEKIHILLWSHRWIDIMQEKDFKRDAEVACFFS